VRLRLALTAAVAALLVVAGSASAGGQVGLPNCAGKLQMKPRSVVLACADANFVAERLSWTGWGSAFAAARGTASVNDCKPTCVAGRFHSYPVALLAEGRQTCGGRRAYSRVVYAFVGRSPFPAGSAADATIPFRCR